MKKRAIFIIGAAIALIAFTLKAEAAEKFAYVDLSRLFSEYNKTKEYDKVLAGKESTYESEREKKVEEVKKFQDKINLMSDKEKESKGTELETKIKTLQEFDRTKQTDLRKEFNEKKGEIIKDIEDAVKQFAEKEGYAYIFNEVGVVYRTKTVDITDKVLDSLNKNYKKQ
jgi:outer membrane protein